MKAVSYSWFNGAVSFRILPRAARVSLLLIVCLVLIAAASLMQGSYPLSLPQVWATLTGNPPDSMAGTVVWQFRFPRLVVSAVAGALFGLSGAVLQYLTRNPLADPSLVGVSQGAGLAVVTVMVAFPEVDPLWRPVLAFAGALCVAAIIQSIAMRRQGGATMRFILTGIGISAFISAITSAMLTYGKIDDAHAALGWLAGSIHAAGWREAASLALCLILLIPGLFLAARNLSALRLGPEVAIGLGVALKPARRAMILLSVAAAAFGVAAVGPLGFVGLVAPHLARRLVSAGVGQHLILTALTGAIVVTLADSVGRIAFAPVQIPAGILTAILGVPVFLALILKQKSY